jgi:hypothetical protein
MVGRIPIIFWSAASNRCVRSATSEQSPARGERCGCCGRWVPHFSSVYAKKRNGNENARKGPAGFPAPHPPQVLVADGHSNGTWHGDGNCRLAMEHRQRRGRVLCFH